jgi:hypothetical protein
MSIVLLRSPDTPIPVLCLVLATDNTQRSDTLRGSMSWPKHFPSGCPGQEAAPATGVVWRLVKSTTPTAEDFVSHYEAKPGKDWGGKDCEACGLSVHRDPADAAALRALPLFRNHRVASGTLTSSHGVMSPTPSRKSASHETWWVPQGVEVSSIFAVPVETEDGGSS